MYEILHDFLKHRRKIFFRQLQGSQRFVIQPENDQMDIARRIDKGLQTRQGFHPQCFRPHDLFPCPFQWRKLHPGRCFAGSRIFFIPASYEFRFTACRT